MKEREKKARHFDLSRRILFTKKGFKRRLIEEWERNTEQPWPCYEETIFGENERIWIRKKGSPYDVFHLIPLEMGGANAWWNIHPVRYPIQTDRLLRRNRDLLRASGHDERMSNQELSHA